MTQERIEQLEQEIRREQGSVAYYQRRVDRREAELARLRAEQQGWREYPSDAAKENEVYYFNGQVGVFIPLELRAHIEAEATKQANERIATLEKQLSAAVESALVGLPYSQKLAHEAIHRAIREGSK